MRTQFKPSKQVKIEEQSATLTYEEIIKELSKQLTPRYLPTGQSSHMLPLFPSKITEAASDEKIYWRPEISHMLPFPLKIPVSTSAEKTYWPPEKRKVESDEIFYFLKEEPKPTQLSLTKIMAILGSPIDEVSPINEEEEKEWVVVSPKESNNNLNEPSEFWDEMEDVLDEARKLKI